MRNCNTSTHFNDYTGKRNGKPLQMKMLVKDVDVDVDECQIR